MVALIVEPDVNQRVVHLPHSQSTEMYSG